MECLLADWCSPRLGMLTRVVLPVLLARRGACLASHLLYGMPTWLQGLSQFPGPLSGSKRGCRQVDLCGLPT